MKFDQKAPSDARKKAAHILAEALQAVDPYNAVKEHVTLEGSTLHISNTKYNLDQYRSVYVFGAGKGVAPMIVAIEEILGDYLTSGIGIVKYGHSQSTHKVSIVEAAHPIPDLSGLKGTDNILKMLAETTPDDLIIVLLTGGASALLESPAESIELKDMQVMSELLLASGATINEINCIRKNCSQVKGGGLARKAPLNTMITIILSDVVGSPLDIIASGPTVPDPSTWHDALSIIKKYKLEQKLPPAIVNRIDAGMQQHIADTPKIRDKIFNQKKSFVIGDNYLAAKRACQVAQTMGFNSLLLTTFLQGEAKEAAKFIVSIGLEIKSSNAPVAPPACVVVGGETTVTLTETNGVGGRKQELALAAAIELDGIPNITLASFATDGSDGPTTGAGGIVDGTTVDRGRKKGLQIDDYLQRHDSYHFLQSVGDLIETGPTLTNVNDLILLIVE